jgi:hypothetical protein
MSEAVFCQAPFNYINDQGTETERTHAVTKTVLNARTASLPGWEDCGFELMNIPSSLDHWDSDEQIASVHYQEVRELAQQLTGCDFALVNSHIKRGPDQAKRHEDLGPISFVHSDFADSYGDLMRERYTAGEEAQAYLQSIGASVDDIKNCSRLMIIQFWRNLGEAKMDLPLAFCDARTVTNRDLRPFPVQDYAGEGFDFETLGVASNERHKWYVFPEMTRDEVVVFRTYDSAMIGSQQPYWTPHSAFNDPEVQPNQPARSSIELRATCIFR